MFFTRFFVFLLITLLFARISSQDVLNINQHNFDNILSLYDYVLVDFFLPWCGPCQKLGPEFSRAASRLKQLNKSIALAQVNAHENQFLIQKFTILEYPTLKFYAVGIELPYKGGDTEDEIYKWMRLRAITSTRLLGSIEDLEQMSENNDLLIAYLGKKDESFEIFEKVTKTYENLNFAHYFDEEEGENRVLIFKKEKKFVYNPSQFSFHELRAFINRYQTEVILPLDKYNAYKIFDEGKAGLVLLLDDSMKSDQALEDFRKFLTLEPEFKEKFIPYLGDYKQEFPRTFMQLFNIQNEDLPQIRIVTPQKYSKNVDRYEPPNKSIISPNSISAFCKIYLTGSLKKVLKSQPIPLENNERVKILVGNNFESIVHDESKDVLVTFYAHWCHHCQHFEAVFRSLADQISNNPTIVLGKIDATQNEIENIQINAYPTLKLFPAKNKHNPIEFSGNRDIPSLVDFLKKHASFPWPSFNQAHNSNEPIELTLDNFDEIVYKSESHVLVNFYVTPCGYCRQLDPTYKNLIPEIKNLGMEILVTRIDWIKHNARRVNVRAFPSVFLFLKQDKERPIEYQGDRSFDDLVRFLKENCAEKKEEKKADNMNSGRIEKIDKTNFRDRVYNENHDFVLILYRRSLKEKYLETLTKLYESFENRKDKHSILFGETDLDQNPLPEEISYQLELARLPSLAIFIRQYKKSPTQFTGSFEKLEEIIAFVAKESSFTLETTIEENSKIKCDEKQCKEEL